MYCNADPKKEPPARVSAVPQANQMYAPGTNIENSKSVKVFQPLTLHWQPEYINAPPSSQPTLYTSNASVSNDEQVQPPTRTVHPPSADGTSMYKITKTTMDGDYNWQKMP